MAAIAGSIKGIKLLGEPYAGTGRNFAEVSVTFGTYTASTDTVIVSSVATAIQNKRRDGKTVTLKDVSEGQSGHDGTNEVYLDTLAVSTADITGELSDIDGTEINAAALTRAATFVVSYKLA